MHSCGKRWSAHSGTLSLSLVRWSLSAFPDPPNLPCIGWREWIALPQLSVIALKVKVDTGAKTSALGARNIERFRRGKRDHVRFQVHPLQRRDDIIIPCNAPLLDERVVTDSGGHRESRYVISTLIQLGPHRWESELTLSDRTTMRFRMLLGRTALQGRFLVHPGKSYLIGKKPPLPTEWGAPHV